MEQATVATAYEHITLPVLGILPTALVLLALLPIFAILGFLSGRARRERQIADGKGIEQLVGDSSLGAILALLGLLLAFSFGNALALLESRKADIIAEANALGTAFLRWRGRRAGSQGGGPLSSR